MKRTLLSFLLAMGTTAPFVSVPLAAQNSLETAKIPFAFTVNGKHLPAGGYSVSWASRSGQIFSIRNVEDSSSAFLQMPIADGRTKEEPSLEFACYGRQCVLSGINTPYGDATYRLSKSSIEKNLSHRLSMATMISIRLGAH